jgi:cold shock CspA family protein
VHSSMLSLERLQALGTLADRIAKPDPALYISSLVEALMGQPDKRMTGAVRHLSKGHGYIAGDDGVNYYLHWTAMRPDSIDFRQLRVRERVSFATMPNMKKEVTPRAVDVYVLPVLQYETEANHTNGG